jgi:hypothetical protein
MMRAILFVGFASLIFGQSDRGSIIGIVSDSQARLVQHAQVDAKNMETGKQYSVESSAVGTYRFTSLPEGTYEVSVIVPHVAEAYVKDVKTSRLEPARVDIVLKTK